MRTDFDFAPLYRATVGFDRVFDMLDSVAGQPSHGGYPPYNIEKTADDAWRIVMAVAAAKSLFEWHARHRFCARCGAPTRPSKGGWQRDCGACGAQHFPRTDPVTIMLVEHDDRLLLGRQPRFPPRIFSALAGFVEPGETIEEAVACVKDLPAKGLLLTLDYLGESVSSAAAASAAAAP